MERIRTVDAVGTVLCHDITEIVPGKFKGAAFKKGHVVRPEDVEVLLRLGKENLFVWKCEEGWVHENEAALRITQCVAGSGITLTDPVEGKVNLVAAGAGLLKIQVEKLAELNELEQIVVATLHTDQLVSAGQVVAAARVIPLVIEETRLIQAAQVCAAHPLISVHSLRPLTAGIITTGNEVYCGRIEDGFGPVVVDKLKHLGCKVKEAVILPDDSARIAAAIQAMVNRGTELIIVTGGMSVDADDATPGAIAAAGAEIITHGAPLFPGAMFLLAYLDHVPVVGLPGCAMYNKITVFDLVLPRLLAGERLTRRDLTRLGHGGLCLGCAECRFPACTFGKG
ncbi:MAG TPA: molybdopterin-binding protein [Bacillota bacterium]|nr:molybdopterin-binding protein [Bacillota bacterium]